MTERDLESSVSQLLVELLDDDFSLLLEVILSGPLKSDLEDMLSALIDSGSLSDNLGRDNQIVKDFIINAGEGSGVWDLLVVLALVRDDGSLGNSEEVHLLVLREQVSVLSNNIDIFSLERVWEINDTTADFSIILGFEGVFISLSDLDLRESVLLLLGLSAEFV